MWKCSSPRVLSLILLMTMSLIQACGTTHRRDSGTKLSLIDIAVETVQREKQSFTIRNLTPGEADWEWLISESETGRKVLRTRERQPVIKLPRGTYDVLVVARGANEVRRHFRRYLSVLPPVFSESDADEVIDLSTVRSESLVKDYGNLRRPGYKILIKGKFHGRIKFVGLRGTRNNPVHIINEGLVEIGAANDTYPFAWLWGDDNQYILLDGKADPAVPYGFRLTGHREKSGQIFFMGGKFNKGFELCGLHLVGNQGNAHGGAAIQLQTSYSEDCNASNWSFEYFKVHHSKIEKATSEGMYLGYFTDEVRKTGFAPYRLGKVLVYRDTITHSGWDAIQIASADEFEVHDNYVDGASLSGKRSHSSFLSWNNGNREGYCYRNTFRNCAHAATIIFGETGKEAYIYANLFEEGEFPDNINTPGFFYSKAYNAHNDIGLYIVHNTIITSRISAKIDYRNTRGPAIPVVYAGNAIIQNRLNQKRYPEIAMGSDFVDSGHWLIRNLWRMQEKEHEMEWTDTYKPLPGSPLTKLDFDITKHISKLKGGFYDRDGYPLRHDGNGYTWGCFSAYQIIDPDNTTAHGIP